MKHGLALTLLIITPAIALYRICGPARFKFVAGYWVAISLVTYAIYARDKRSARAGGDRVPERLLHLLEVSGGWPGALAAQHRLRHKNAKPGYQISFWLIVTLHQAVAIDGLLGWPAWRGLSREVTNLLH